MEPRRSWDSFLIALDAYRRQNGCAAVPARYRTPDGYGLGARVWTMRVMRHQGQLSSEQIAQLDAHHFVWDPRHQGVAAAIECVLAGPRPAISGRCVRYLRQARLRRRLLPAEIAHLDAFGFAWHPDSDRFTDLITNLDLFVAANGRLPQLARDRQDERRLADRLRHHTAFLAADRLSAQRVEELRPILVAHFAAGLSA